MCDIVVVKINYVYHGVRRTPVCLAAYEQGKRDWGMSDHLETV
jgi:hypothetical protein